ncbi:phosphoenolpyruvate carboxykinase (ATP) [Iris pallida]|uniref:Phosphoenolpyruvate carboxykinase (ATP) n=1 Tax=Iris pallida TaxID=29817 RepID=A0AAX6IBH7_IRIPA|nr:phosphoenolpyruvate carboxykinase (ATP) [Iris pallida]
MLHPTKYAAKLVEKIQKYGATGWLVNTGWSGGRYGVGNHIKLPYTRKIIDAIHLGSILDANYVKTEVFIVSSSRQYLIAMHIFEGDEKFEDIMLGDLINWPKGFNLLEFEYLLLVLFFCIKFVCILEYSFLQFDVYV